MKKNVMYKSYKLTRIINILDKGDLSSVVFKMNMFSSIKCGEAFCLFFKSTSIGSVELVCISNISETSI